MPNALTQSDYQVTVIDPTTGLTRAVFDPATFYELRYSRALDDVGQLTLTLPYTNQFRSVFVTDCFIEVTRTSPITGVLAVEDTYLARLFNRYRQGNEERYVVGGLHLNHLIARRLIDPADDIFGAGGYSTYAGPADQVMYNYAYFNLGPGASLSRQIPNLIITPVFGLGAGVGFRLRFDELLKTFQDAARAGSMDFNIRRAGGNNLVLDIATIGSDRRQSTNYPFTSWVGLDPMRSNLSDPNLQIDRKSEKNVVYALGQGQDVNRALLKIADTSTGDSPFNRVEYSDAAGNLAKDDPNALLTFAKASLIKNRLAQQFTYRPTQFEPGNIYQQDWFLGDKITVTYDEFTSDLRITNVEAFISNQGETLQVKVETI